MGTISQAEQKGGRTLNGPRRRSSVLAVSLGACKPSHLPARQPACLPATPLPSEIGPAWQGGCAALPKGMCREYLRTMAQGRLKRVLVGLRFTVYISVQYFWGMG